MAAIKMRIPPSCAACLYDKQVRISRNDSYLAEIHALLENRSPEDTAPYMVYRFGQLHEKYYGQPASYREQKRHYNELVLHMEVQLRNRIQNSQDPLAQALAYARIGNYIDFGAMEHVDEATFMGLFAGARLSESEQETYASFIKACETADSFLLLADNCGEIVLDKLFLEQLHRKFPEMQLRVMVRGGEVLNDATPEDARFVGLDRIAELCTNGHALAGTIYDMLPEASRNLLDASQVILAKGQANYESLNGQGRHIFYSFLCKCDYFSERFGVPKLTGMFLEEK